MNALAVSDVEQDEINMKALKEYDRIKSQYLALCRRHGLNPFDLDVMSVTSSRIPRMDKSSLVSMIMRLIRLEKRLKSMIGNGLFPLTVQESERSGYMVPAHR